MTKQENSRLTEALQGVGWTDSEITNFILWVKTGEKQYDPKQKPSK